MVQSNSTLGLAPHKLNMLTLFVFAFLADCICVMTEQSYMVWLKLPYFIPIFIQIILAVYSLCYLFQNKCHLKLYYLLPVTVLILVSIGIFRGMFAVEGYWGYKGWLQCSLSALTFVLLFPLGNPSVSGKILQSWNKYIFLSFLFVGIWAMLPTSYVFHVPFTYNFYVLLFSIIINDSKARFIIICGIVCTLIGFENRSGVIKTLIGIFLCTTLWLPELLRKITNHTLHFVFYVLPIVLLILGLTGTFNIFQDLSSVESTEVTMTFTGNDDEEVVVNEDLTADTRTALYEEVIASAIMGDYVLFGNTVGRGNTHNGEWSQDIEGYDDSERLMNEAMMLNIFTWMGLIGIILYTLMYLQASCLGIFCSRNKYIPVIACATAFHWAMSWMEEPTQFKPMDFSFFILLGICFSSRFRKMSDAEFSLWFRSCFASPQKLSAYDVFNRIRLALVVKHKMRQK